MKISIMQPYFFPYLGYFTLIKHTDMFVLLDTVQHIRHGWVDRNRILRPESGWQYIKVPIRKHSRETKIINIEINNDTKWKDRIIGQLQHYKKIAPYYSKTIELIKEIFSVHYENITELNYNILSFICYFLKIDTNIQIFSKMNLEISTPNRSDEWALNICKSIPGVTEYWNPYGGASLFDTKKYLNNSIDIKFIKNNLPIYSQKRKNFESGLSIIDVMMFNDISTINSFIDDFNFN